MCDIAQLDQRRGACCAILRLSSAAVASCSLTPRAHTAHPYHEPIPRAQTAHLYCVPIPTIPCCIIALYYNTIMSAQEILRNNFTAKNMSGHMIRE